MAAKPKYLIIHEWLTEQIANGNYLPGDKIPNEIELAAMFGVQRMTVRQAVDKLVSDRILMRKRGQGTYLLPAEGAVPTRSLATISSYHNDIATAGLNPRYKLLEVKVIPADEYVAKQLGLAKGTDVISLFRLMLASGVPLVLERSYLPAHLLTGLLGSSLETNIYEVIAKNYNMTLSYSRNEIGAIIPTKEERKLLRITTQCACLWVEGVVYNDKDFAVEYSRALCRGDKYRFKCSSGKYVCEKIDP
jgi:GntR family transcriptional regulator